ncbi:hypothetical protein B9Z36_07300 [Limnohabitans sp. Rim8]|nr:hypothetical protein B9Z36_07300 [Limnohabitans sp. Rim8]
MRCRHTEHLRCHVACCLELINSINCHQKVNQNKSSSVSFFLVTLERKHTMQFKAKQPLMILGFVSVLSLACVAQAANPLEQINQEIDKHQQRGKEHANEHRNRHEQGHKTEHHGESNGSSTCNDERNLRSLQGNVHTSMKFLNNSNQEVRTYWLDYSGRRVFYKAIPPHGQYTQPTFQTHPWVVTDQRDKCLNIYVSNQPSGIAEIR